MRIAARTSSVPDRVRGPRGEIQIRTTVFAFAAAALIGLTGVAGAAEVEVQMLNQGEQGRMVFEPSVIKIQPGDTVKFIPTDKGHNVEGIEGMLPEGVAPFKSKLGEEFSMTFDTAGAYGYKCTPHVFMGMVGLIVVGDEPNLDGIKNTTVPPAARERFDADLVALEAL
jgi:pseudoazurin